MFGLVTAALAFISEVVPMLSTASAVAKAIEQLTVLVPVVIKEARDLAPMIKSTINALRGSDGVTDEQLAELDALEVEIDAAFDTAAANAEAEDAAAGAAAPLTD